MRGGVRAACAIAFVLGLADAAAQDRPRDAPVLLVADRRLTVATSAGSGDLALFVSRDWDEPQPAITRAIVTVHGLYRTALTSRTIAEASRAASGLDPDLVLLIEPQFLNDVDVAAQGLPAATLHWRAPVGGRRRRRWTGADLKLCRPRCDPCAPRRCRLFPALKTVVVAGHSGGGQIVQRYAVAGRGETLLVPAGIHVRYVVANPSSFLYFGRWKYGLNHWPAYLAGDDRKALETEYAGRDVIYLLGAADDDPNLRVLDRSCMAEAEGPTHIARGLAYFRYLKERRSTGLAHRLFVVPEVGHNESGMFLSACGLAALYDLPGCDAG